MSYNTRRTAGSGPQRGQQLTQVNYHQAVAKPPTNQSTPGRGYTTSTTPYNSAAQPAYSTPQPTQQYQNPNLSVPKTTPPQPQTTPTPAATTPVAATPAPPVQPAVKQEPVTPGAAPPPPPTAENGEPLKKGTGPYWANKKKISKLSNKIRKQRQNAKLRKILNPKNALTLLNEIRPGGIKYVTKEEPGWGFTASVEIDGKNYSGHGLTVSKAKVQASEAALREMLLEKMAKAQSAPPPVKQEKKDGEEEKEGDEAMETDEGAEGEGKKSTKPPPPEDDVPWGSLAAFALHKLLLEWQRDGVELPGDKYNEMGDEGYYPRHSPGDFGGYPPRRFGPGPPRPGPYPPPPGPPGGRFGPYPPRGHVPPFMRPPPAAAGQGAPYTPKHALPSPKPMKKIPDDALQKHPVMLLNQMKPNLVYKETRSGSPPNLVFTTTVELDGNQYSGSGKNKKEAKKNAAKAALVPLGIVYPEGV